MKDVCFELLGESASNKINCVPSLNNTITRRVDETEEDVEEQLLQQIKKSSYYSLQIDESADVTIWRLYWRTCGTNTPMM
jgi:hypothetical protein